MGVLVLKERVFFYRRILEIVPRQKPVLNGHKKTPENRGFRGSELRASKTVVLGDNLIYPVNTMDSQGLSLEFDIPVPEEIIDRSFFGNGRDGLRFNIGFYFYSDAVNDREILCLGHTV